MLFPDIQILESRVVPKHLQSVQRVHADRCNRDRRSTKGGWLDGYCAHTAADRLRVWRRYPGAVTDRHRGISSRIRNPRRAAPLFRMRVTRVPNLIAVHVRLVRVGDERAVVRRLAQLSPSSSLCATAARGAIKAWCVRVGIATVRNSVAVRVARGPVTDPVTRRGFHTVSASAGKYRAPFSIPSPSASGVATASVVK